MQYQSKISEEIQLLIIEFLEGKISDIDLATLNNWFEEKEDHRLLFNEFKAAWLLSMSSGDSFSSSSALLKVKSEINREKKVGRTIFWNKYRIAASWVLIFGLGSVITWLISGEPESKKNTDLITTFTAPIGSKAQVDLPDGSKVWLNAGSQIMYNNNFGRMSRKVQLTGEAFFKVKSDKENPFYVVTTDLVVKAVGTEFNVKAYPEEEMITTTLEEGKVLLSVKGNHQQVIALKPMQNAVYKRGVDVNNSGNRIEVKDNFATELVTSWKEPVWILESESLGSFAVLLERRYNVKIDFENDEVKNFKFTGKIHNESIEQILKAMELTAPVQYSIQRNVVRIYLSSKNKSKFQKYTN